MLLLLVQMPGGGGFNFYDVDSNTRAFMVYVITQFEEPSLFQSYANVLYDERFGLSLESKAYLVMSLYKIAGNNSQVKRLRDEILSQVKKESTTSHFEETRNYYSTMGSNNATTASILEMLVLIDPKNPLIPEILRYLSISNNENHWGSTRTNATVFKSNKHIFIIQ